MNIADSYTFQDAKLVLLSPWERLGLERLGLVLALGIALMAFILTAWGYRHQPRRSIRPRDSSCS